MKIINIACLFILVLFISAKKADSDISTNIKNAIKMGDAVALSAFFDQNLELVIDSEKVDYNKINTAHAKLILKSFFKKKPPLDFHFEYKGATASIQYCTGNYRSISEQYWVYIIIKNKKNKLAIGSLHFKKDTKS
ncbi:MAG: DUF4783 domain-containing protein [Bacteroidota bacterium]